MQLNKKFKFSIVIPTLNEENYISECIDSILKQTYDLELIEIVIVDGNSTDKTLEIVNSYTQKHAHILLLNNAFKRTPISLNIGIKNSTGDVAVILGAHTKIDKDFVKLNNQYLIEQNVKVTGGTQINVGKSFSQRLIASVMEMPFAMASASYRWSKKAQFVDTVVYAAYKKELFDELGYFEEEFAISEDAEMNWRIRQAGYKIYFSPDIKTYYYPRSSITGFIKQMFRYGILRVNVLKKHMDAIKLFHFIPPVFVITIFSFLILGSFNIIFLKLLSLILILYFLVNIFASIHKLGWKKWFQFPIVSLMVFSMHIAWGIGFIVGAILPKSKRW